MMYLKETFIGFENLFREQKQVFDDASDVGLPFCTDVNDRLKRLIGEATAGGCQLGSTYEANNVRTTKLFFMTERNGHNPSMIDGLLVTITVTITSGSMLPSFRNRGNGDPVFYRIKIKRDTQHESKLL